MQKQAPVWRCSIEDRVGLRYARVRKLESEGDDQEPGDVRRRGVVSLSTIIFLRDFW